MIMESLNNFVEMERNGINPFGFFGDLKQALKKEKEVVKYILSTLEPDDELYFMKNKFEKVLKCQRGILLDRNYSDSDASLEEREKPKKVKASVTKEDCGYAFDIHCSTKRRGGKIDEMNLILNECKSKGYSSIMVTIVPPVYLNTPLSDKEVINRFYSVVHSIFGTNQKHFTENFYVYAKSKFYEVPVKGTDFRVYPHVHFIMTFKNREFKRNFFKKFKEFKTKVYEVMVKHFNIKNKEYYKENCAYINVIKNSETGEEDILELEDAEYLRKPYGNKGKSKKNFKDWDEKRRNYYKNKLKNPEHFDEDKGLFIVFSEDEEKVAREFYSKIFVISEKNDKHFCLNFDEILWIGGEITKKDRALKKKDYKKYCRIMHLKTWALKRYLRQLSYLFEPDRHTIAIRLARIGNEHYSIAGGSDKVKAELKRIKDEEKEKREMRDREEYKNDRREESIDSIEDEKIRREIKEISEENDSKYKEDVKKQKLKLAKVAGYTYGKIDLEIFHRWNRIFRTGVKLYDYLWKAEIEDGLVSNDDLTDCIKDEKGALDWKDGLKRLYELTEEFDLDRTQIFLSEYLFKGNEYEKYFPVKIPSNKSIDSDLELKLGITLKEFDSIWYFYRIEELKSVVTQLITNAKNRENLSREEFESNVDKILYKMRNIKFNNNRQLEYIVIF